MSGGASASPDVLLAVYDTTSLILTKNCSKSKGMRKYELARIGVIEKCEKRSMFQGELFG